MSPPTPAADAGSRMGGTHVLWTLHYLDKFYPIAVDLLSEIPGVLKEIGLTRVPHYTVRPTGFERIPAKMWRVFSARRPRNAPAKFKLNLYSRTTPEI